MKYEPGYEPQPIDLDSLSPAARELLVKHFAPLLDDAPDVEIGRHDA